MPPAAILGITKAAIPPAILTGGFSEQELRDAGTVEVFESIQTLDQTLLK